MRNFNSAIMVTLGILLVVSWVQPNVLAKTTDSGYKIGVVNLDHVATGYEYRTKQVEELGAQFRSRTDRINEEFNSLRARRDGLASRSASLPEEEQFKLSLSIDDDLYALEQQFARLDADTARAKTRLELTVSHDIQEAIETLAYQENYHLVFAVRDGNPNGVVYASSTVNMTMKLIDRLNETHRANK